MFSSKVKIAVMKLMCLNPEKKYSESAFACMQGRLRIEYLFN